MERIDKLREHMKDYHIDGMLISSFTNRRYITHFTGTAGVALLSQTDAKLVTDFRYVDQAKDQATAFEIVQHQGPMVDELSKQIENMGIKSLGFEQDHLTYSMYDTYNKNFNTKMVAISGLIEKIRLIKDTSEIKILKEAAKIADDAFSHIISFIKPGLKEIDVSNELEFFMRKQGATSSSFDIIVASGLRSALPHGVASNKIIENGELVTLDFGAYYQGYCSDITRTVAVGQPNDELKKIYHTVLEAQLKGMNGIKAGMTGRQADALTRDHISNKGYGEFFGHSTGHGLGLEVHEGPALSMRSDTILKPGMIVTVEPGIYVSGIGGTRIEDDIIITESGNETLTHSTKDLLILGD